MKKSPPPIEFLKRAQEDPKISAMVRAALEKGAEVTAAEVLKIANSSGYRFTRKQFEASVRKSYAERFAAGDWSVTDVLVEPKLKPPESSCARGCVSYTKNYCPRLK
jgi:Nif11 domain